MDSSRKQKLLICVIHTQKLQLREPTLKATLTNLKSIPGWETQVEFINERELIEMCERLQSEIHLFRAVTDAQL
jgi:hypothetical protein